VRPWRYAFARQALGGMTAVLVAKTLWEVSPDLPQADAELFITRDMPESAADR
jgi:hypothetical protein